NLYDDDATLREEALRSFGDDLQRLAPQLFVLRRRDENDVKGGEEIAAQIGEGVGADYGRAVHELRVLQIGVDCADRLTGRVEEDNLPGAPAQRFDAHLPRAGKEVQPARSRYEIGAEQVEQVLLDAVHHRARLVARH